MQTLGIQANIVCLDVITKNNFYDVCHLKKITQAVKKMIFNFFFFFLPKATQITFSIVLNCILATIFAEETTLFVFK